MRYDLWDVETGNAVAYYRTAAEMATLVRTLASEYGSACADELHLTIEDDAGAVLQKLTGAALLAWAEEVQRGGDDPGEEHGGRVIASTLGAISPEFGIDARSARLARRLESPAARQAGRGRATPTAPKKGRAWLRRDH
jgi:hypothetical protein